MSTSGQRVEGVRLLDTDVAGPLRFEQCTFVACTVRGLKRRARIRDIELEGCTVERGTDVMSVWLTDVTVRDLRIGAGGPRFVNGSIFERVTIAGRISGSVVLDSRLTVVNDELSATFAAEAEAAYSDIDWALDISAAETTELSIRDVPTSLVRRDASTQAVVRAKNISFDWEAIDFENTWFRAAVHSVARGDTRESILVTPMRAKNAPAFLRVLGRLRDAGIADPD